MKRIFSQLKLFIYNTWFLAFVLTLPFIFFLPYKPVKYQTKVYKKRWSKGVKIQYVDLNNDGDKEQINYFKNFNKLSILVYDHAGGLVGQWNFEKNYYISSFEIYTGDINNNGFKEVFGFTSKEDSVFLGYTEPMGKDTKVHTFFIDKIATRNSYPIIYGITDASCIDMNGDTFPDLVFNISAGYSLQPRKVYWFDFRNHKLHKSPEAGEVIQTLVFDDLDNDGKPEIFGETDPSFNYQEKDTAPYKDNSAWLFVYDNNLHFLFNPISFGNYYSDLNTYSCVYKGRKCLISWFNPSRDIYGHPCLMIHDITGKLLNSDTLRYVPSGQGNALIKKNDTEFYLLEKNRNLYEINTSFKVIRQYKLPSDFEGWARVYDLNRDNDPEIVLENMQVPELIILSANFKHENVVRLERGEENIYKITFFDNRLFFYTDLNQYFISYRVNRFYYLQVPIYLGVYLFFLILLHFIKKAQESRAREKYSFLSQVMSLELRAFRNQMDPHFTMNAFNLITSLFNKGKNEDAMNVFMKFSKLIRQNLEHFEDLTRTLKEELDAAESFLEISRLRFPGRVNFKVNLSDPGLLEQLVPKMIILTHVENAVKHGLIPKGAPGNIEINVREEDHILIIEIEDNGIGRNKAAELKTGGSGLGLDLVQKLIEHLNNGKTAKISQEIIDQEDPAGNPCGTRIFIKLPINFLTQTYAR